MNKDLLEKYNAIDWTPLVEYPPTELQCACGKVFRGYAKLISLNGKHWHVTKEPCPDCSSINTIVRTRSYYLPFTIGEK